MSHIPDPGQSLALPRLLAAIAFAHAVGLAAAPAFQRLHRIRMME